MRKYRGEKGIGNSLAGMAVKGQSALVVDENAIRVIVRAGIDEDAGR